MKWLAVRRFNYIDSICSVVLGMALVMEMWIPAVLLLVSGAIVSAGVEKIAARDDNSKPTNS